MSTFQLAMFWLNAVVLLNRLAIFETDATFHLPMSALNVGLLANNKVMLVTASVFHSTTLPYVATAVVGLVAQASTAAPMLPFVMAVCPCATGVKAQLKVSTAPMSRRRLTLSGNVDGRGRHFGGRTWIEPASSKTRPNLTS
jgi:hypothetical protein